MLPNSEGVCVHNLCEDRKYYDVEAEECKDVMEQCDHYMLRANACVSCKDKRIQPNSVGKCFSMPEHCLMIDQEGLCVHC